MRASRVDRRRLAVSLGGAALALSLVACEPTNQGYAPPQPVNYSHAVHAGGLRIPCLYCHYGAERGRHAGIPPASVCLNCHRQVLPDHPEVRKVKAAVEGGTPIEWVRIHQLPDHAYFNHQAPVKAGVACQSTPNFTTSTSLHPNPAPPSAPSGCCTRFGNSGLPMLSTSLY